MGLPLLSALTPTSGPIEAPAMVSSSADDLQFGSFLFYILGEQFLANFIAESVTDSSLRFDACFPLQNVCIKVNTGCISMTFFTR